MTEIITDNENNIIEKKIYYIYVDGACSLKKNNGGIGVYCEQLNLNISLCINNLFDKKTNSISELYAVKHALNILNGLNLSNDDNYIILSDSKYVVESLTNWIHKWKKNNWLRADKKPILHKDLISEIYDLIIKLNISIKWIPREKNTIADKLAKNSIK